MTQHQETWEGDAKKKEAMQFILKKSYANWQEANKEMLSSLADLIADVHLFNELWGTDYSLIQTEDLVREVEGMITNTELYGGKTEKVQFYEAGYRKALSDVQKIIRAKINGE